MSENNKISFLISERLRKASSINQLICTLIASKASGQDIVLNDEDALGCMVLLEGLGHSLDEAANQLQKQVIA
jgi:hypothetical protein